MYIHANEKTILNGKRWTDGRVSRVSAAVV